MVVTTNNIFSVLLAHETSVGGDELFSGQITETVHGHCVGMVTKVVLVNFVYVGLEDVESMEELLSIIRLFVGLHEFDEHIFILLIGKEMG